MDLRDLAYFEVIADLGHLGRAAERLGRTQPALTKCIHRLEASVGAALFSRVGRGIQLTPVGAVLLERARRMRSAMDEVLREVGNFAHGAVGNVRIGTGATTAEYLLPEVCSAVLAQTPGVTFEIVIGMNDVLRQSLRAGNLDVVVGPLSAGDEEEWVVHDLGEDVVVVAAAREHELIGHPVDVRDLRAYRWVLPAASVATRQWLDRAFEAQGLPGPEVQIQTNVISLLPRLIAKTDLLSFISRRNLGPGRAGEPLAEIPVAATTMPRRLGLVHRKDGYLPPAALQFISVIRSKADEVLRSS